MHSPARHRAEGADSSGMGLLHEPCKERVAMCVHTLVPSSKSLRSLTLRDRAGRWLSVPVAAACVAVLGGASAAGGAKNADMHWVATWATAPATFLTYVPPVPPVYPPGAPTTFAPANIQPDLGFPFP